MMRTKEIYYRNKSHKIPVDDLKHFNGYDVAKLSNQIYVFYDDLDSKWKPATKIQIEEYTGKRYINVEIDGNMIESLSYVDLDEEIENKRVSKKNKIFFNDFLSLKKTNRPRISELTKGSKWE